MVQNGRPNQVLVRFHYEPKNYEPDMLGGGDSLGFYREIDMLIDVRNIKSAMGPYQSVTIIKEYGLDMGWFLGQDMDDVEYDGTTLYIRAVRYDQACATLRSIIVAWGREQSRHRDEPPFPGGPDDPEDPGHDRQQGEAPR